MGPRATLALTRAPDFTGIVVKVTAESGAGPAGRFSQRDVWLAVTGASKTTAGVVVPLTTPVFIRGSDGAVHAARVTDIGEWQSIQVWHDASVAYGAVQGPPGAPTYTAVQVVIIQ